jgi:hypothetical protein
VTGDGVGDRSVNAISRFPKLRVARFEGCNFGDKGLGATANCITLEHLCLEEMEISLQGLAHLHELPNLRVLSLWNAWLEGAAFEQLAKCSKLEQLNLQGTVVNDPGLHCLGGLSNLGSSRILLVANWAYLKGHAGNEWVQIWERPSSSGAYVSRLKGSTMSAEIMHDQGQQLGSPTGKVLGIVDSKSICENVALSLQAAGFPKVQVLVGEEGIRLLERVDQFFFSDMEERVLARHLEELRAGHAIIAITTPADRVNEAVSVASELGARRLVHFGSLTVTWLTK